MTLLPAHPKSLADAFYLLPFFKKRLEMMKGEWRWKTVVTRVGPRLPPATSFDSRFSPSIHLFFAICEMMEGAAATEEGKSRFEWLTLCDESPGYELLAS